MLQTDIDQSESTNMQQAPTKRSGQEQQAPTKAHLCNVGGCIHPPQHGASSGTCDNTALT